jgi:WD40 repeat protein
LATNKGIWDLSGRKYQGFKKYKDPLDTIDVMDISFRPDGKRVMTTNTITASIWDLAETPSQPEQSWVANLGDKFVKVYFSPDRENLHLATLSYGTSPYGTARIWDLSGKKIDKFNDLDNQVTSIGFDRSGKILAISDRNGFVQLWDGLGQHPLTPKWSAHPNQKVSSVSFSPDSQRLLTAGDDNIIRLWDVSTRTMPKQLNQWQMEGPFAIFSPNGRYIVSGGYILRVWELRGQELRKLAEWRPNVRVTRSVEFSPNSDQIVTSGDDYVAPVRVWDLSGKEQLKILPSKQDRVEQVSFSPDSQLLATAGIDGTAQLWTLSGLKVAQFAPYGVNLDKQGVWMRSVSFSPDGKLLATADEPDGKVRLWKIDNIDELLDRGCVWLKEYLTSHPDAPKVCPYQ